MKKLALALAFSTIVGAVAGCLSGCNGAQSPGSVATDVLDVGQVACVLLNAELDVPAIQKTCNILNVAGPTITQILAAHKQGVGIAKPGGCR
jgi:hypothetical protein